MAACDDVILEWIDGAAKAARRVRRDPNDVDALHRFRINIRRLVVSLDAIEKPCGVPAKLRKRLRRALRGTGPWRDGHVKALWLDGHLRRARLHGSGAVVLRKAFSRIDAPMPDSRWWRKLDKTLLKMRCAIAASPLEKPALRAVRREAAEKQWLRLIRRLRGLDETRDRASLHRARIAVKKLRYLLEAMEAAPRGLPETPALHALQSALGEAHDREVIAAGIAPKGQTAGLRPPLRRALKQLEREKRARLSCAKRLWKPLIGRRR